jgi:transposase
MANPPSRSLPILPDACDLTCEELRAEDGVVTVVASSSAGGSTCPKCWARSTLVHSRYTRILNDLPWQGSRVQIRLFVRRFYCRHESCSQRIFAERLPGVAKYYGRQTYRLSEIVRAIGYALGGEGGARLAERLGVECSADSILRKLKAESDARPSGCVRIVGIDDWAWRRCHRYGTILIDLERKRAIDLLPNRSSEAVTQWLREHPSVEVVSRDRAGVYAEAATLGAPEALQVADRWHLLCNLTKALQRMVERLSNLLLRREFEKRLLYDR